VRHRRRHGPTLDALTAKLSDDPADRLRDAIIQSPMVLRATIMREAQEHEGAAAALDDLLRSGEVRAFGSDDGTRLATAEFVDRAYAKALEIVDAFHAEHPLRPGMPVEELRARLHIGQRELAALLEAWPDIGAGAAVVARASFRPTPSPDQRAAMDAYLASLRATPEHPPAVTLDAEQTAYLADCGEIVDTGDGVVFDATAFDVMQRRVRAHIEEHGAITLAEARDMLGTSRRYVQSLLEHMDRLRVTRRVGERRVLR
jgi:selenocysteine-specific elongation factor